MKFVIWLKVFKIKQMKLKTGLIALLAIGSSAYGQVVIDSTEVKTATQYTEVIEITEPSLEEKKQELKALKEESHAKEKALEEKLKAAKAKEKEASNARKEVAKNEKKLEKARKKAEKEHKNLEKAHKKVAKAEKGLDKLNNRFAKESKKYEALKGSDKLTEEKDIKFREKLLNLENKIREQELEVEKKKRTLDKLL